jgi:pimeloyl-ACP methyl ester carboxylesterase
LRNSPKVSVADRKFILEFVPVTANRNTALIFICGSGISAHAYAPLLRPIAEDGYAVFVVKLPYRFAPLESHKQSAVAETIGLIAAHPEYDRWVLSGHSLGAALSCRSVQEQPNAFAEMVLVGTTHPKLDNLNYLSIPVTKIYGSKDGVATPASVLENKGLLPTHTNWVEIVGGNHSQFGHYGHQLFDGYATLTRSEQQAITRTELLNSLNRVEGRDVEQSHATEPAVGSVLKSTHLAPAR